MKTEELLSVSYPELTITEKVTEWCAHSDFQSHSYSPSWTTTLDHVQQSDSTWQGDIDDIDDMPNRSSTKQGEYSESEQSGKSGPRELLERYKDSKEKPIFFKQAIDAGTPSRVTDLLYKLPLYKRSGIRVIPGSLKARIENGDFTQSPPEHAYDSNRDDVGVTRDAGEQTRDIEWYRLAVDIISKANRLLSDNAAEKKWKKLAEGLVEQVISLTEFPQRLQVHNTSDASVDKSLLPVGFQARKPDLALGFSGRDETTREGYDLFRKAEPLLKTGPYIDPELSRMIFPVCIEVGGLEKSNVEANLQVAVWAAAALQKYEDLGNAVLPTLSADNVPPLVTFTCIGKDWKIHVAYRNKNLLHW